LIDIDIASGPAVLHIVGAQFGGRVLGNKKLLRRLFRIVGYAS
jgi:hypothetical protein